MAKSRTNTFCPYCCKVVPAGKTCPCRNRDARRKRLEPWRENYSDQEYVRNRQAAIERQRGRCKDCGRIAAQWDGSSWKTKGIGEVDHEVPLCQGGTNDVCNLALRCLPCHRRADAERRAAR